MEALKPGTWVLYERRVLTGKTVKLMLDGQEIDAPALLHASSLCLGQVQTYDEQSWLLIVNEMDYVPHPALKHVLERMPEERIIRRDQILFSWEDPAP